MRGFGFEKAFLYEMEAEKSQRPFMALWLKPLCKKKSPNGVKKRIIKSGDCPFKKTIFEEQTCL
jgi:hypothetical protein